MARPAQAIIDLDAIRYNLRVAKECAPGSTTIAIVKANAYGHGAAAVCGALVDDADLFGVACIEEALEIRESGIQQQILLLEGVFEPDELAQCVAANFSIVVATPEQIDWLVKARLKQALDVFLKVDTGMHRLGLDNSDVAQGLATLNGSDNVKSLTLMSHFACADEPEHQKNPQQILAFEQTATAIKEQLNSQSILRSLANSAAVLASPDSHGDYIRPGIMLYGANPLGDEHAIKLKPAMTLRSALISVREVAAGESIGYAERYTCSKPTRVGVVAMGYADGYPRHSIDGTPVLVNGQRSQIIGRVSMDMLTVDLTDQPNAQIGDPVELWGNNISANTVATHCDTIAYTLFTGLTRRVPISYINA